MAEKRNIRCLSRPLDFEAGDDLTALDEAASASPRAAAIIATSVVEDALRWSLCGFLIPNLDEAEMFDNEGAPLSSFHAKIVMGYALGIYGQVTREDLRRMQRVRNAFAHSPRAITFQTLEITEQCLALSYVDYAVINARRAKLPVRVSTAVDLREKFLQTARLLMIDLHAIASPSHAHAVGEMP
jgi:hypothetical protein